MIEAIPAGPMPYHPATNSNTLDLVIALVVLAPLVSAAWDIMKKAWKEEA